MPCRGCAIEGAILREGWLRARERLPCEVYEDAGDTSRVVAAEVAALIRARQREGEPRYAAQPRRLRHRQHCQHGSHALQSELRGLRACLQALLSPTAGRPCVLGLATGSTPMHVYQELVRLHRCATQAHTRQPALGLLCRGLVGLQGLRAATVLLPAAALASRQPCLQRLNCSALALPLHRPLYCPPFCLAGRRAFPLPMW